MATFFSCCTYEGSHFYFPYLDKFGLVDDGEGPMADDCVGPVNDAHHFLVFFSYHSCHTFLYFAIIIL